MQNYMKNKDSSSKELAVELESYSRRRTIFYEYNNIIFKDNINKVTELGLVEEFFVKYEVCILYYIIYIH